MVIARPAAVARSPSSLTARVAGAIFRCKSEMSALIFTTSSLNVTTSHPLPPMDAKPCEHCGKPVSDTALICPHCGGTGPRAHENRRAFGMGCGLTLLMVLGFCGYVASDRGEPAPYLAPATQSDVPRERWDAVANVIRENGATVDPYNMSRPREMSIRLPAGYDTDEAQARRLAEMAHSRLGDRALVFVRNAAGRSIARASSLGVE